MKVAHLLSPFFRSVQCKYFLGSAIFPSIAEAAHVAGEAKYIFDLLFPIRPLKFLFAVDITFSPSPGTPKWVPGQGPQPGGIIVAPASSKEEMTPSLVASIKIRLEAGQTRSLTSL